MKYGAEVHRNLKEIFLGLQRPPPRLQARGACSSQGLCPSSLGGCDRMPRREPAYSCASCRTP